jgi:hypothetical protein
MNYVQAFYVENSKIILDNLPQEVYDGMRADGLLDLTDDSPWTTKINYLERVYHIVFSRRKETINDFMNGVFYLTEV